MSSIFSGLIIFWIVIGPLTAWRSVDKCKRQIQNEYSNEFLQKNLAQDNTWLRVRSEDRAVAFLFQPKDLNQKEFTVVCNFQNGKSDKILLETFDGNKIAEFINTSKTLLNPFNW